MFECTLSKGATGEQVRMVQKALNEDLQTPTPLLTDGQFGPKMVSALSLFQTKYQLDVTGRYGDNENAIIGPVVDARFLMDSDIDRLSEEVELPGIVMKAVRQVEGKADGFLPDGRPLILFERHKFYKYLGMRATPAELARTVQKYPDICNPEAGGYLGREAEYPRLEKAIQIASDEAYMSASYGMFQLMGFNYMSGGFSNVVDMVNAHSESEQLQFTAIVGFIKANPKLHQAVLNADPVGIARNYNGSNYAVNNYHTKIAKAIEQYSN